jgi:tRNA-dihydrouridine synthase 2
VKNQTAHQRKRHNRTRAGNRKTGVSAIGIQKRLAAPKDPAHWDVIKQVVDSVSCPVIANGDVFEYQDFDRIREATGASAAMAARGAMWNQIIFSKDGLVTPRETLMKLMAKCLEWDHSMNIIKYLARCIVKCFRLASIQLRAGTFSFVPFISVDAL